MTNEAQASAENNRLILETITDEAIYLLDTSGRILSRNGGTSKIHGYLTSDTINKNFSILYSPNEVKSGKPSCHLVNAEAQGKFEEEANRLRKDGTAFWASVAIFAILDETGNPMGFIKRVRDISRLRDDAVALLEARAMLEAQVKERTLDLLRSNSELEQFAYIASHDLQTPLRHISSFVQLLTSKIRNTNALDAKAEKWIEYILNGTKQMKSLITDLLSYSRIGRVDIQVEEIDIEKLLKQVMDELREPIRTANAKIVYSEIPKIFGIKSQILQLFQNLVENSIKFKKPHIDPIVTICCKDHGEFWRFLVTDNGIGINSKYSERIFLMFHRLHTAEEYPGTGIGLSICKKIVEFHGGKIGLDSDESEGAIFSFILPKKERVTSMALVKEKSLAFEKNLESLPAKSAEKQLTS
jgi:PAS domain S-box-containing protein